MKKMECMIVDVVTVTLLLVLVLSIGRSDCSIGEQPLSKIAIHKAILSLTDSASIKAKPLRLGHNVFFTPFSQFYLSILL